LKSKGNIDAIFSDGPPHTNTRIAYHLSRKFNIPWIADFQDPWTQVDYYKLLKIAPVADKIHKKMEQGVFKQASLITIASPSWAKDLQKIGAKGVKVLYYGYDEEDFLHTELSNEQRKILGSLENRFVINHAGLLGMDRFPEKFLEVLSEIARGSDEFKKELLLYFPGEVDYSIKQCIRDLSLEQNTTYPGHISKDLAVESMKKSSLLLLPLNKAENVKGRLPGKLYEYLRSYTPVLALGPEDSDVNHILKQTQTGICLNYDDRNKIKEYILSVYTGFKKLESTTSYLKEEISRFDVKNQTQILAGYLNEVIDGE
jgi:glycosyltransferase involved in cell wall biosynthesis